MQSEQHKAKPAQSCLVLLYSVPLQLHIVRYCLMTFFLEHRLFLRGIDFLQVWELAHVPAMAWTSGCLQKSGT
jgi:hypothetical protein